MRRLPAVEAEISRRCNAIAAACGDGYEASVKKGKNRVRGSVITATPAAMQDNATNNTLMNNLGAGS